MLEQVSVGYGTPEVFTDRVRGVGLCDEGDDIAIGWLGAVSTPEVVARDDDEPALRPILGNAICRATRRLEVPVATVVAAAGHRDRDEWRPRGGGRRRDDRRAHCQRF